MSDEELALLTGLDYKRLALKVIALEQQLLETRSNGEALRLRVGQLEARMNAPYLAELGVNRWDTTAQHDDEPSEEES